MKTAGCFGRSRPVVARIFLSASISAAALMAAQSTLARDTAPGPAGGEQQVEDIVVTAQRREERLSTVPIAVTAFKAADLERSQIHDFRDLAANVPGVSLSASTFGNTDLVLSIRGIATSTVLANSDTAVGIYVDGLYYARPQASNVGMVDISSAEVLRGPQGTLFGRNTIGGAFNVTTNQPTDKLEGSVKIGFGNYGQATGTGVLNIPIIDDRLDARFVMSHTSHDGYGYDQKNQQPLSDQNDNFFRASIKAQPTEKIKINLTGDYYTGTAHSSLWVLNYLDKSSPFYPFLAPYYSGQQVRTTSPNFNPLRRSRSYDLTGTVAIDLDWATLKSITGYRYVDFKSANDLDGVPSSLLDDDFAQKDKQFSQELQLGGSGLGEKLKWLTGLYYFNENITDVNAAYLLPFISHLDFSTKNTSKSAFAQATYEILPKVRLTGGARYVSDTRYFTYPSTLAAYPGKPALAPALACPVLQAGLNQDPGGCNYVPPSAKFHYVPWTVGLDFQPDDRTLMYAKISKGYRSGGFQQPGGKTASYYTPFGPENVLAEELGVKLGLFDRALFLDAAAYHTGYRKIQQNNVQILTPGGSPTIAVFNAGSAEIYGGEISATAVIERLRLNTALGYIDPKFTKGPYAGSPLPNVAKFTWSARADYPIDVGPGVLTLHADYEYKSRVYYANTINSGVTPAASYSPAQIASFTQPGFGLLNGRISYDLNDAGISIAVWTKNLTNKYYGARFGNNFSNGWNNTLVGDPRTFGMTVAYKFGPK